ncbi:beta-glucosidase [Amycolatopsis balhimycina DSM 5908]|uniref:Beta-glucosidase n=1 Tax=Amycolatopsis balhimycina DSM 5908 TaxID=1081091 RepID=A0A428WJH2_AMYBA|nr:GH1 family beta-glucosidase [Amycolatopsis balhimycina]RSM43172.1 beta-glucosidase [Amycolatopsis balhimycina DSM 5908]
MTFPPDFVFGTATSAFQIEGAWNTDGKGPSIWDTFGHTPGKVHRDIPGDVAADHYHRYREDIALLRQLGCGSYRFSMSWPRILPEGTGRVNRAALDFYRRLVDELLDAGISPLVTLYHWDLPQALEDRGGWGNRDIALWFRDYAALVFEEFAGLVPRWATLNEPISMWVGYGMGTFAPGHADPRLGKQAMHNALLAHGEAVRAFREQGDPGAEIGIVVDVWQRHPATGDPADQALADRDEDDSFRFFFNPLLNGTYGERIVERLTREGTLPDIRDGDLGLIASPVDFLGVNVYSRVVVSAENYNPIWWESDGGGPGGNFLDNGLEYYPKAAYDAIRLVRDDYGWQGPMYITENGTPDADGADPIEDHERIRYVRGFLEWIERAVEEGADVRGYYLWSLLDNYEWNAGFSKRYGIVHVDPDTLERTPKASFDWYRDVIARRGVA